MDFVNYGFESSMMPEDSQGIPARITAVHRGRYEVVCELGQGLASLKAGEYYNGEELFPTTGDFVLIDWQGEGESRILKTLSRRTLFSRLDPSSSGHAAQAVAANFDYVFIMQSLNHDFNVRRLERYLTLTWQSGAEPVIVLTKADLVPDYSEQVGEAETVSFGVKVIVISAKTGFGLEQLSDYLMPGKTIVFLGSSGVGKSSLVNALAQSDFMDVKEIREEDSRGRHTTTYRQLILLPQGYMLIDTPGMRELGMWDVTEGIGQSFADVEEYLGKCKFSDCRHKTEPGCAVQKAIADGNLSAQRWNSYLKLKKEVKYTDDKMGYLRERQQRHKEFEKSKRMRKKTDK